MSEETKPKAAEKAPEPKPEAVAEAPGPISPEHESGSWEQTQRVNEAQEKVREAEQSSAKKR